MEKKSVSGLDHIDRKILAHLQQDSSITHRDLAARINLSTTPVYERIKKLEGQGYIKKYVALVDNRKVGKALVAYCHVSLKEHAKPVIKKFEKEVLKLNEVVECYNVTGNYDYMLKVIAKDMDEYQDFIVNKLAILDNIGNTYTSIVLSEVSHSTVVPLH